MVEDGENWHFDKAIFVWEEADMRFCYMKKGERNGDKLKFVKRGRCFTSG